MAWRKHLDVVRAEASRRRREERVEEEPAPGPARGHDDTLQLYFLCAHPSLSPASAVALTLRAVGGLTTRQIAAAYLVPEATMAQRISRAKRTVAGVPLDQPGDVATVLRVLYLVFNEGYSGDVDLAAEAIRLTRRLAALVDHPEVQGLLALMLLHHARRPARTAPDGSLVTLAEQDRSRWDTAMIAEGVGVLQAALARDRLGDHQAQAAIAALHADARSAQETDWVQVVEWYDELVRLTGNPVALLNRAVAVGEADGPQAGLAALAEVDPGLPRHTAVAAHLHERAGDHELAGRLYVRARPWPATRPSATTSCARPPGCTRPGDPPGRAGESALGLAPLVQALLGLAEVGQAGGVGGADVGVLLVQVEDPAVHGGHEAVVVAGAVGRPAPAVAGARRGALGGAHRAGDPVDELVVGARGVDLHDRERSGLCGRLALARGPGGDHQDVSGLSCRPRAAARGSARGGRARWR